jgi:hypothetical protein
MFETIGHLGSTNPEISEFPVEEGGKTENFGNLFAFGPNLSGGLR